MRQEQCVACEHFFDYEKTKTGQSILNGDYICSACATQLGIPMGVKGVAVAMTYTKMRVLKEYAVKHPETQKRILAENEKSKKNGERLKETVSDFFKSLAGFAEMISSGEKEMTEEKFTCTSCGNVYFKAHVDETKCPKCGSMQTKHETIRFRVDRDGNKID
ncbi:MAG: hypothetical protein MJ113_06535 [Lachnospiraceae bacterium]|nr:hypothetical protein [Lachnospiraceae bacterium]